MIRAEDFCALICRAQREGWGYIWGTSGQTWSKQDQSALEKKYHSHPEQYADLRRSALYGSRWIGKRVADCSGLAAWAFRMLGGSVYHGSNTIWNQFVLDRCALRQNPETGDVERADGTAMLPGDPVFLRKMVRGAWNRHHIGYFLGDGQVIEARGAAEGVVTSPLSRWQETAHWRNMIYEGGRIELDQPILKKGCAGDAVRQLQQLLSQAGQPLNADGIFGAKTEAALRAYQAANGLQPDGIAGDMTWRALLAENGTENKENKEPTVALKRADLDAVLNILKKYEGANNG